MLTPPNLTGRTLHITIGVHGDDGAEAHAGGSEFAEDGALIPGAGLTVAEVGALHEFGTRTIPQRSFIRGWFDERQDFIRATLRSQMALVLQGKLSLETAGNRIALACEGDVKRRIAAGIEPPLAQSTIDRKGSSRALVDTGQLRNAVRGRAEIK